MKNRPNVVCIITDQLRFDHIGCMGNTVVRTPHIDRLAARGTLFRRAYTPSPICQPSRTAMLTGQYPRNVHRRGMHIPQDPGIVTLPEILSEEGYATHGAGKFHLGAWSGVVDGGSSGPEMSGSWVRGEIAHLPEPYYGFQTTDFVGGHAGWSYGEHSNWLQSVNPEQAARLRTGHPENTNLGFLGGRFWSMDPELHYNRWIADRSIDCIERCHSQQQPFFLWTSFPDPHWPYMTPEPYHSMYDRGSIELPEYREGEADSLPPYFRRALANEHLLTKNGPESEADLREMIAVTYGMVTHIDDEVGRICDRLESLGLLDNTLIVFTSDHGDMMGDHGVVRKGPFQFRGCIQVPCIYAMPGRFEGGKVSDALVSHVDLAPTVLDLCGIEQWAEPESLPKGGQTLQNLPPSPLPGRSLAGILSGESERIHDGIIVENDADYLGERIRTFVTDKYRLTVFAGKTYGELFDLEADPGEFHNRWDDPGYAAVKAELIGRFFSEYVLTESARPKNLLGRKSLGYHHFKEGLPSL